MRILALDLGTNCGWCRVDTSVDPAQWLWGRLNFSIHRYEGGGIRYLRFERKLDEFFEGRRPDLVVFEEVSFSRFQQAAEVLNAMTGILMKRCEEKDIPYQGVPVGTLKKFATGKGNCGKEAMLEAAHRFLPEIDGAGSPKLSHDEADAILLARYAVENLVPAREGVA